MNSQVPIEFDCVFSAPFNPMAIQNYKEPYKYAANKAFKYDVSF